jgi:dTDP-4-dehydrorhamnose 3,5-epimerase
MIFEATPLAGTYLVDLERHEDSRGFFARSYCADEFEAKGLVSEWPQSNVSFNRLKGTLRGLHYNAEPYGETKLVRCTVGAIYDVIVDLRPDSATTMSWIGVELSAKTGRALYVPAGLAHGFITLVDDTEVFYQMSNRYIPQAARGLRYDDPVLGVSWPIPAEVVSQRDRSYPDLDLRDFVGELS